MSHPDDCRATFDCFEGPLRAPSLTPAYLRADAKRDSDLTPTVFTCRAEGHAYYHPFHLAPVPGTEFQDVQSAYGYGGPVADGTDDGFLGRVWDAYRAWCRERRVLVEFVRFHPLLENWRFYRGEVFEERPTVWIDLDAPDLLATYQTLRRRQVRKAASQGLRVTWEQDEPFLRSFLPLYEAMLDRKGADPFYRFTPAYYEAMTALPAARCAVCRRGEEVVAAGIFFVGPELMEYHLGGASTAGQECGAMTLLLHEAALLGQRAGCRRFHLGGGTDNRPDNALLFFKGGFSAHRASFRIGRFVHDEDAYQRLRAEWQRRRGEAPRYVLFYRV
jgi:hypothetical protein